MSTSAGPADGLGQLVWGRAQQAVVAVTHSPIWSTRNEPSGCLVQVQGVLAVVESLPWRKE